MSTQTSSVTIGYDNSPDVAHAAHALVHYRDGLMRHLLWVAEMTSGLMPTAAANVFVPLLAVLEAEERDRTAVRLAHIASDAYRDLYPGGPDTDVAMDILRAVCLATAERVAHVLRLDAFLTRQVTR